MLIHPEDLINDTYACDNDKMLNDVLKRECAFQGYVMSDWSAQHTTESAITGLDVRGIYFVLGQGADSNLDDYAWRYHVRLWHLILRTEPYRLCEQWHDSRIPY